MSLVRSEMGALRRRVVERGTNILDGRVIAQVWLVKRNRQGLLIGEPGTACPLLVFARHTHTPVSCKLVLGTTRIFGNLVVVHRTRARQAARLCFAYRGPGLGKEASSTAKS